MRGAHTHLVIFAALALALVAAPALAAHSARRSNDGELAAPARAPREAPAPHARGRLGVQVSPLTPELRSHFGAPADAGVLISRVAPEGPAYRAGLRVGDVLIRIDGHSIRNADDVLGALASKSRGRVLALVVVRGQRAHTARVLLDSKPPSTAEAESGPQRAPPARSAPGRTWTRSFQWEWRWPGRGESKQNRSRDKHAAHRE